MIKIVKENEDDFRRLIKAKYYIDEEMEGIEDVELEEVKIELPTDMLDHIKR